MQRVQNVIFIYIIEKLTIISQENYRTSKNGDVSEKP